MSAYYMSKCATLKLGQLQRKSRHDAAKATTRSPVRTNATRDNHSPIFVIEDYTR